MHKDLPNVFIGINDCGKTTILKAIGLLLDEKPTFFYTKDNSSKKDFSNSPLSRESFVQSLNALNLPELSYHENESIILGKFILEDGDIDVNNLTNYSNHLLWAIENNTSSDIWFGKLFDSNSSNVRSVLLTQDFVENNQELQAWNLGVRELDRKIKELEISSDDIQNTNGRGRFSNLEKVRAIYEKTGTSPIWSNYKIDKGDKLVFPSYRYLDWNSSLEDIKKTATDALASTIDIRLKPLRVQAYDAARETEQEINNQLAGLQVSIAEVIPSITAIKTKVYFDVKESITDILINKAKSDGDIHLDLQGEGVKRQIWFALIKAGALANISSGVKNKKFIWAFDEPETHLYPSAQRQFFEIIKEVSMSNVQTFVCTHSTVFIDKSKLNSIKSVSIDESYTLFSECDSADEIFESLELRNSDFLFYDKFLVIEGDTEFYLIPELYKLYRGNSLEQDNIQLINLTGKSKWTESKKALENVLRGFKKSFDYVIYLFDSDMRNDLGAGALNNNFFFVGKQDIEDSIDVKIWKEFVTESTEGKVVLKEEEITEIVNDIPEDVNISSNEKFFKRLERLTKQKLTEATGEQVTWDILPSKGNESAQLLLKHLNEKKAIPSQIIAAFDKIINQPI